MTGQPPIGPSHHEHQDLFRQRRDGQPKHRLDVVRGVGDGEIFHKNGAVWELMAVWVLRYHRLTELKLTLADFLGENSESTGFSPSVPHLRRVAYAAKFFVKSPLSCHCGYWGVFGIEKVGELFWSGW